MKIGQAVTYVDASGDASPATVVALTGSGASGVKRLDVRVGSSVEHDVAHQGDHAPGEGCWMLDGEHPSAAAVAAEPAQEPEPEPEPEPIIEEEWPHQEPFEDE